MTPHSSRDLLLQITDSLHEYVHSLKAEGVGGLPCTEKAEYGDRVKGRQDDWVTGKHEESLTPPLLVPPSQSATPSISPQAGDLFLSPLVQGAQTLEDLRAEIGDCRRCKLCQGRIHIVFGVGNPQAEIIFVGEGPGRDEDLRGEPFVGRAGQLLTEIITKGMKMRREEVYIANVVKCRPPENRNPEPDEIAACEPFLVKQIDLIQPRVIIALGTFAAQTLLKIKTPISRLRGIWHSYQGIKLMPTLHPAYLLRNPNDKRLVWQDIQAVLRELGRL